MGALNTKQWAEVLTTGSPGSPEAAESRTAITDSAENSPGPADVEVDEEIEGSGDLPRPKHRNLKMLDPRSVSDDVERTPIQLEKSAKSKIGKSDDGDNENAGENGDDETAGENGDNDVSKNVDDEEEETDTSGQELLSQEFLSTPTAIDKQLNKFKHLAIDPRSPSNGVNRTPIVVESPLLASNDTDTPKKAPEVRPPKRGVFANNEITAAQ